MGCNRVSYDPLSFDHPFLEIISQKWTCRVKRWAEIKGFWEASATCPPKSVTIRNWLSWGLFIPDILATSCLTALLVAPGISVQWEAGACPCSQVSPTKNSLFCPWPQHPRMGCSPRFGTLYRNDCVHHSYLETLTLSLLAALPKQTWDKDLDVSSLFGKGSQEAQGREWRMPDWEETRADGCVLTRSYPVVSGTQSCWGTSRREHLTCLSRARRLGCLPSVLIPCC